MPKILGIGVFCSKTTLQIHRNKYLGLEQSHLLTSHLLSMVWLKDTHSCDQLDDSLSIIIC